MEDLVQQFLGVFNEFYLAASAIVGNAVLLARATANAKGNAAIGAAHKVLDQIALKFLDRSE